MNRKVSLLAVLLLSLCGLDAGAQAPPADLLQRANQAYRAGDLARATALLQEALKRNPDATPVHMLLAIVSSQAGNWDQATEHFEAVLRLDPSNAQAHYYLGVAFRAQGNWAAAAQSFSRALENEFPQKERLSIELAFAQVQSEDPGGALATLQSVREPSEKALAAEYLATQAFALAQLEKPHAAIGSIRRALQLHPLNTPYWDFYISTLIGTGQTIVALSEAIGAQRRFPNHPDIQYRFGVAAQYVPGSPFTKLALRRFKEAVPGDPRALLLKGLIGRSENQIAEVKKLLTQAAREGVGEAHFFLGILLEEERNYSESAQSLRRAEEARPLDGQVYLALGRVLLALDQLGEAQVRLMKAEQYMPSSVEVQELLSKVYLTLGQKEKAEDHARRARELLAQREERPAPRLLSR